MKASRDSLLKALRLHGLVIPAMLLCQCALPPRQAWQAIRTQGLLTYWGQDTRQSSPPFSPGASHSQRYAASRSSYAAPRYSGRSSPYWGYGTASRVPYQAPPTQAHRRYGNRYYATPSGADTTVVTPRPAPRPRSSPSSPPTTRMTVEEPVSTPPVAKNDPPASSHNVAPKPNDTTGAKPVADLPYGTAVPGRPNMVNSPYAGKTQLVDVAGMGAGQTVKCPYTGKLFKVPSSQQATNTAEPKLESKIDSSKVNADPKAEDKKP